MAPVPEGYEICHHCDNPPCAREDHLFVGTQAENIQDAARKGRRATGEKHGSAKLTKDEVLEILAAEGVSQRELARRYGVSARQIGRIVQRKGWVA